MVRTYPGVPHGSPHGGGPPVAGRRPPVVKATPIPAVTANVAEERPPANIQAVVTEPAASNAPNT
ncbi:hypothetical protein [Streptomyces canus]|uniref:hypothetical protein n=1 Tax=Streptomyces canus TaxID=58343 RepID=UPI00277EEC8E|nr:hypothetical protein [Streptomyces canus]MDQ0764744.1 hypothetical protein [Streptomyces canus]